MCGIPLEKRIKILVLARRWGSSVVAAVHQIGNAQSAHRNNDMYLFHVVPKLKGLYTLRKQYLQWNYAGVIMNTVMKHIWKNHSNCSTTQHLCDQYISIDSLFGLLSVVVRDNKSLPFFNLPKLVCSFSQLLFSRYCTKILFVKLKLKKSKKF